MYEVHYEKHVARKLMRMPRNIARQFHDKVNTVATNPYGHHSNVTRLKGRQNSFRLRIGNWRIVYVLDEERNAFLVAKIGQRGQVYR